MKPESWRVVQADGTVVTVQTPDGKHERIHMVTTEKPLKKIPLTAKKTPVHQTPTDVMTPAARKAAGPYAPLTTPDLLQQLLLRNKPFTSDEVADLVLTPQKYPLTLWVLVEPWLAEKLLEKNIDNRDMQETWVYKWATEMGAGRWVMIHSGIAINTKGIVYDCQHRLEAIVRSGKAQQFNISIGFPTAAKRATDVGLKRTLADMLKWEGYSDCHVLASSLNLHYKYEQVITAGDKFAPSNELALKILKRLGKDFTDAVRDGATIANDDNCQARATSLAVFIYLARKEYGDGPELERYLKQLRLIDCPSGTPARRVLNVLKEGNSPMPGERRMSNIDQLACIIKGWGGHITGRAPHKGYRWLIGEQMPRILGKGELF